MPWRLLAMLALALAVAVWPWVAPSLVCTASALYLVPLWVALSLSSAEAAYVRRVGFITRYLAAGGKLGGLLRPGLLLVLIQGFKSLFLLLLLITAVMALNPGQRGLLVVDALALPLFLMGMRRLLADELREDLRHALLRQWTHRLNAVLLWLGLLAVALLSPYPDYGGQDWREIWYAAATDTPPACDVLALLGRIQAVGEAMSAWTVQNLAAVDAGGERRIPAWLLALVISGVSFLVAWLHSRLLTGALAQPWGWRKDGDGA